MLTFDQLGLKNNIISSLVDMGYNVPSEVQQKVIPQIISSSQDLMAFAQTGTGKTAAFSLPIIQNIDMSAVHVQAVILSPTRELAFQIGDQIQKFSKNIDGLKVVTVYGGANIDEQIRKLDKSPQIVVGTPGRTLDLIKRGKLKLKKLNWLVLDEADEMLNMGFKEDLDIIVETTPKTKQTLLFSATFSKEVRAIAGNYMNSPLEISVGKKNEGSDNIDHQYYVVTDRNRYRVVKCILDLNVDIYGIIFCRTKRECQQILEKLTIDKYNADALHGDLSQLQRDTVMQKFRGKKIQVLVATDVAARGLDVENLTHVINHRLPDQDEIYTHRSGRTGRAGNTGVSIMLVSSREVSKLSFIEKKIGKKFVKKELPSGKEICEVQLLNLVQKIKNTKVNEEEITQYLESAYKEFESLSREELIQKFISVEFNRFLQYYSKMGDFKEEIDLKNERRNRSDENNMARFFINIGKKDHLNPSRLIELIQNQNISKNIEIGEIEILDTFSFFELDKNFEEQILSSFLENSIVFEGRSVNIEVTKRSRFSNKRNFGKPKNVRFFEKRHSKNENKTIGKLRVSKKYKKR